MSKKHKQKLRKKKLEQRTNSVKGQRKLRYANMADKEILGTKELKKYQQMYDFLHQGSPTFSFPSVYNERLPRRPDYISLRILYRGHIS